MAMRSVSPFARDSLGLIGPLVFSVTGLLADNAVLIEGGNHLAPAWRFALVAGAPALAAIAAIKVAGDDLQETGSGNYFGRR